MSGGGKRWLDQAPDPTGQAIRQALDEAVPRGQPSEDELARQRVWAGVQAPWPPRARRRRWPLVLVSLGAAGAALVVGIRIGHPPRVAVDAPVREPAPTTGSFPIRGTDGPVRRRLARGVDADLSARAALVPGDEQTPPEVKRGRVRFTVPPQVSVRAGAYRVTMLGTVFDVSVENQAVRVVVSSGVVQIEDASGRRLDRVASGEEWSSAPEAAAPTPVPPPALRAPVRRMPESARPAEDPAATRALAEARGARRAGDPRRALALYDRLVAAGGPLAESALFEMASIEDEDLHDRGRALGLWQRYRERYPRGLLRAEADLSIIEVLPRLGQEPRALE